MNKVMVVEDNFDLRKIMSDYIKLIGFEVVSAENGAEAISILSEMNPKPDIFILDLFMPEMNGLEFLIELRSGNVSGCAQTPVILLTAASQDIDIFKQAVKMSQVHIPKPAQLKNLVENIRSLLVVS